MFGLPILISSAFTIIASGWTDKWTNEYAIAFAELLVENATFYPASWLFGKMLPQKEVKEKQEKLHEMIVVESIDLTLRMGCFLLAQRYPSVKGWLAGIGSLLLDVVFLVSLSKSRQLLEIVRRSTEMLSTSLSSRKIKTRVAVRFGSPRIITLGLT